MGIGKLVRKNILALKAYSSARSEFKGEAEVFLDANENPFETGLNRYPDPLQWTLKKAIADLKGIPVEQIFLGNGSDEVIDLMIRIFCEPRIDNIMILPPTYGMYQVSAGIADIGITKVSLTSSFQPDVEAILAAANERTKLLFLCSPNNPTGNSFSKEAMLQLVNEFPGIVIIDEAYIDFSASSSMSDELAQASNLVVMQTFSKAWGLAGIRLGMAFASTEIIALLNKVKPPYNVNQLSQEKALEVLENKEEHLRILQILLEERKKLEQALASLAMVKKVYPSDANFILIKVDDAAGLYNQLVEQKIIVRNRSNVHLCEGGIRISVGRPEENTRLLEVLQHLDKLKVAV